MRYDERIEFLNTGRVSDGMGGWVDSDEATVIGTAECITSPLTAEIALKEYGLVTTSGLKAYTPDPVPDKFEKVGYEGKHYRVIQLADYKELRVLIMEVVE